MPRRDQILPQPLADHRDRIGLAGGMGLEHAGQPVARRALAAGAVADRGILPEGADLVEQRQAAAAAPPAAPRARSAPANGRGAGRAAMRRPAARAGARSARISRHSRSGDGHGGGAGVRWKVMPSTISGSGPVGRVARAGQAGDLPALRQLRLDDRARAEGVAAVQRQAVIEDVQDAHRHFLHAKVLNGASTAIYCPAGRGEADDRQFRARPDATG